MSDNTFEDPDGKEYNIYVGKNATDNWNLIDKANQHDIWLHLGGSRPSPHVIISPIKKIKVHKSAINFGASLCKEHSKYKELKDISVVYAFIRNVRKDTKKIGSVFIKKYEGSIKI